MCFTYHNIVFENNACIDTFFQFIIKLLIEI